MNKTRKFLQDVDDDNDSATGALGIGDFIYWLLRHPLYEWRTRGAAMVSGTPTREPDHFAGEPELYFLVDARFANGADITYRVVFETTPMPLPQPVQAVDETDAGGEFDGNGYLVYSGYRDHTLRRKVVVGEAEKPVRATSLDFTDLIEIKE